MPPTEKALDFYAANLGKVLEQQERQSEYAAPLVTGSSNDALTGIVFEIRTYKTLDKPK